MQDGEAFDYVIVGAGSAGCVIANRLSADSSVRVLLLEAGPEPRSPWIRMPAGLPQLLGDSPYNWPDLTVRESRLSGRRNWIGHGRTLGGSSAINGMVYVRGHPADYEGWRQSGNRGWGWDDVLPHFRRIERREGKGARADGGLGLHGEQAVSDPIYSHPAIRAFIASGEVIGLNRNPDFNGDEQEGVGDYQMTVGKGRRCSAYEAFLRPIRHRSNLTILTGATARRLIIADHRATGVAFDHKGALRTVTARREVILAMGAIDSPRLLLLSGIGPARHLNDVAIAPLLDLPGVGANLHDHLAVGFTADTLPRGSMNGQLQGLRKLGYGLQYLLSRRGPVTMGGSQAGAFARCLPGAEQPDTQLNFRPFSIALDKNGRRIIERQPRISATAAFLQPRSRGSLRLRSNDPEVRPAIDPAYLSDPYDESALLAGVRLLARLFKSGPLAALVTSPSLAGDESWDDEALRAHIRSNAASMLHPVGTCRMGTDPLAVVDDRLRVRGIDGLRVADASIMPSIPSGNTNAPAMMIGSKAADMIAEDWRG